MQSLPVFLRLTGRSVILIGEGEAADAKRRLLERAGAIVVGEGESAALAIVADGDEAAVIRLKARGVLVNATDKPDLCDFTLPAIIDRDPVLIAIGTGGTSAGLAKALRQRIEMLLPQNLGALATALYEARDALRRRWPDPASRRRAIDAGLAKGGAIDALTDMAAANVPDWLSAPQDITPSRLERIELLSSDPDELTLRAARLLGEADRLFHAANVPTPILDRARADAIRIPTDAPPADPGEGLSLWLELRD